MHRYKGFENKLSGDKVRLRVITERDLPKLMEWDEDEEICRWAGKKFSCRDEARDWYLEKPPVSKRTLAIETLDGRFIGEIEILNVSWKLHTGELRVVIGEKNYWNRGIGEDAVFTFAKWVFENYSIKTIYLRVDRENHRARRCYAKVGFKPVGRVKFASMHLILMEISKEQFLEGHSNVHWLSDANRQTV